MATGVVTWADCVCCTSALQDEGEPRMWGGEVWPVTAEDADKVSERTRGRAGGRVVGGGLVSLDSLPLD